MAKSSSYIAGWGTTRPRAVLLRPGPRRDGHMLVVVQLEVGPDGSGCPQGG